jgi:hypothetical protein
VFTIPPRSEMGCVHSPGHSLETQYALTLSSTCCDRIQTGFRLAPNLVRHVASFSQGDRVRAPEPNIASPATGLNAQDPARCP